MIDILRKFVKRDQSQKVEGKLRFYISLSDGIVSIGLFSFIINYKLGVN